MYRPAIRRTSSLKPWMIALIVSAVVLVLAIIIGLLVYFLVFDQKSHYYETSFHIPNIEHNSDYLLEHSKTRDELEQKINDEVDNIFQSSDLRHLYTSAHAFNLRSSNDDLKADVLLKFRFVSRNANAIKSQVTNILHQKFELNEDFLKINTSLPYLRDVSEVQAEHILNSGCGLGKELPSMDRIADGKIAKKADWPWQASLQIDGTHYCGASLISEKWLLTAAHCFDINKNPRVWTVSFGTTLSPALMRKEVQSIVLHENYAPHKNDGDIAVVKLSTPVTFSSNVHRVCLPDANFEVMHENKVFVTGWGALSPDGFYPNSLREVELKIISNDKCNQVDVYGGAVSSGMLCAGFLTGNHDACEGDSGGPLVISHNRNIWYVVGIVSWGIGCAKENKPGVYTKVTHYRDWIKSKTNI